MAIVLLVAPADPKEEPAALYARKILQNMALAAEMLLKCHQEGFAMLWHSQDATPQEIFDHLGEEAANVMLYSSDAVRLMLGVATGRQFVDMQPSEYTPPVPYTINQNGTVTVGVH